MTTSRKGSEFAGLSVALISPFRDGNLDVDALRRQVEFQIAAGTHCLCPVGTTGESPTLSLDEHERVISEVVQAAAGRVKVMPGTGSNSTAEALRLTKWAAREGADAALERATVDRDDLDGPPAGPGVEDEHVQVPRQAGGLVLVLVFVAVTVALIVYLTST